jgi:O-antigen/teichoic acid export membrane protein
VNLIAGFILPRMIDERLGQFQLGVWDFCWSMIGYLGLIDLGSAASVARLLARDRAMGHTDQLTRSVSSMALCMNVLGILILLGAFVASFLVVPQFHHKLGTFVNQAQWIVILLGLGTAVAVFFGVYSSAIVAAHRWDLHNLVSGSVSFAGTAGMVAALLLGGGLVSMSAIYTSCAIGGHLFRWKAASRVCPELHIDWRRAEFRVVREQARFAAKNLLPRFADMLVNQTVSLLLAVFAGPAALAVFSRPRALTKHVRTLVGKFSAILTPSASALQAQDDHLGVRQMFLRRSKQASCFSVPALLWLAVIGGPFISVWMGQDYFHAGLVPILTVGYLASLIQDPVWAIMTGLNRHGRIAFVKLGGSLACAMAVALGLYFGQDKLLWAALGLTLPMMVVDGILVPTIACRALKVSLREFYHLTLLEPFMLFLPSGICLVAARLVFPAQPLLLLVIGGSIAGLVQVVMFYKFALPERLRLQLRRLSFSRV